MNEPVRGTYTLVLENPDPLPGERRIIRKVLVHDFANPKMHIRDRMDLLLAEMRTVPNFRGPGREGAWKGQWEVHKMDWELLLYHGDANSLREVQCERLFGYPVLER